MRQEASAAATDLYKKAREQEDRAWKMIHEAHPEIEENSGWSVNVRKGVAYKP